MFWPESSKSGSGVANSPSVVIIAIDMEHLVALDTEDTVRNTVLIGFHGRIAREPYPERTHSVRPERGVVSSGVKQRGRSDGTYRCRGRRHRIRGRYHPSWRVKLGEINEIENIKKIPQLSRRGDSSGRMRRGSGAWSL